MIFCSLFSAIETNAQGILTPDYVVVSGYVMNAESDSVLAFANVYNPRTMRGTVTNQEGEFRYYALPGDTLWFSSMGYYPLHLKVPDLPGETIRDTFYLKARIYQVPDVDVLALTRYEKLRHDVKNMTIPRDVENARDNFPVINHRVNAFYERNTETFGMVMSPISALYDAFSKEGRERRKLVELMAQDDRKKALELHFNKQMVMDITGLDEAQAEEFMEYCDFSEEFLLNAQDYYIIEILLEQYEHFCDLHELKE